MNDYMKTVISAIKTWVLKNRTHYAEPAPVKVLKDTTMYFESEEGWYDNWGFTTDHVFEPNKEYTVTFDGVEYACLSRASETDKIYIGNGTLCGSEGGNGEPFGIRVYADVVDDQYAVIFAQTGGNHAYSISTIGEVVHPLDEKYLPDTVATKKFVKEHVDESIVRSDWNEKNWDSAAFIENKPFYAETYEGTVETKDGYAISYLEIEFVDGVGNLSDIIGTGDGTQFLEIHKEYNVDVSGDYIDSAYCSYRYGDDGNEYPEMWLYLSDGSSLTFFWYGEAEVPYMGVTHLNADGDPVLGTQVYTITMYTEKEDVHTLDEKFIPDSVKAQADWNQDDPEAPDYVKNRTHWIEPSAGFVLANDTYFHGETYTVTVGSDGYAEPVYVDAGVIDEDGEREGGKFRVTWDGVEYEVYHGSRNENMMPELGYDRYDLPFTISALPSVTRIYLNDELGPYSPGTYDVTVKIEYLEPDTYHKIPMEFMPRNLATVEYVDTNINAKAPKSHASSATTYGRGNSSYYGHVKLSDATDSTSNAGSGVAATPKAVKTVYDLATSKATMGEVNTAIEAAIGTAIGGSY